MAVAYNPTVLSEGMQLILDAANVKSYSGSGTSWFDLSGNGNTNTLTNGPTFSSSNQGSFLFDGTNDYSACPAISAISGNNARTITVWFKTSNAINMPLFGAGSNSGGAANQIYAATFAGSSPPANPGGIYVAFWSNDLYFPLTSAVVFDGAWKFIAYSYSAAGNVQFCYNGTFPTTAYRWSGVWTTLTSQPFQLLSSLNTTNTAITIGNASVALWSTGSTYFQGNIAHVNIYNRYLSQAEMLQTFNATRGRFGI